MKRKTCKNPVNPTRMHNTIDVCKWNAWIVPYNNRVQTLQKTTKDVSRIKGQCAGSLENENQRVDLGKWNNTIYSEFYDALQKEYYCAVHTDLGYAVMYLE